MPSAMPAQYSGMARLVSLLVSCSECPSAGIAASYPQKYLHSPALCLQANSRCPEFSKGTLSMAKVGAHLTPQQAAACMGQHC